MAQYYDNAIKYVMLGYSQEFAEFMVGHSNIKVLERLETEQPTLKAHQNDSTLKVQLRNETAIFHTEGTNRRQQKTDVGPSCRV